MILVSECLCGVPCRMDGQSKPKDEVIRLLEAGLAVPVCPEVLGGLPTPRAPSEIRDGRVVNSEGMDVTEAFARGAREALRICREKGCTIAIMKSKSPSCGYRVIHNGRFDGGLCEGNGKCVDLLLEAGVEVLTENDLGDATMRRLLAMGKEADHAAQ
ncbi:MAG: DUF523 domain-containing protein [Clostridia bacterium]|nr:DUF523 domain-containing protein [Clostridia bacterium]MBR2287413.1 DUF523 domain-containing protein [Clostridia bacterium]